MTVLADETPAGVVISEVVALAGVLRQLWPDMPELMATRHAATFVRIGERTYGPADPVAAARLVLLQPHVDPDGVPDDLCVELGGGMFLRKWTSGMDRRPAKALPRWKDPEWAPGGSEYVRHSRGGTFYPGSARHGECTACCKARVLRQAVYRLGDANDTYSRSSLCGPCGRKQSGGPVVVPKFDSPEQAQAWLDAQSA